MNASKITKSLILAAALCTATAIVAAPENTGKSSVQFDSPVNVNGTQLAPGHYNLKWATTPSGTELQFISSRNGVTTVPAHFVDLDHKTSQSSVDTVRADNGDQTLTAIHISGKSFALAIGETAAAAATSSATAGQK